MFLAEAVGLVSAACILVGTLEPAGFEPAANIVVVGYLLWSIWLVLTGIFLLLTRPNQAPSTSSGQPDRESGYPDESWAASDRGR